MSWRNGSELLLKIWPEVKSGIDDDLRKDFGKELVQLFIAYDIDTYDIFEADPELDAIVSSIYDNAELEKSDDETNGGRNETEHRKSEKSSSVIEIKRNDGSTMNFDLALHDSNWFKKNILMDDRIYTVKSWPERILKFCDTNFSLPNARGIALYTLEMVQAKEVDFPSLYLDRDASWELISYGIDHGSLTKDNFPHHYYLKAILRHDLSLDELTSVSDFYLFSSDYESRDAWARTLFGFLSNAHLCPRQCVFTHLNGKKGDFDCSIYIEKIFAMIEWHLDRYPEFEIENIVNAESFVSSKKLIEKLEFLLELGLDPNCRVGYLMNINFEHEGANLLMAAAAHGNLMGVKKLLEYGADLSQKDGCGNTALEFAKKRNKKSVVKYIEQYKN